jgi:HAD superfamily 5'-nucleotidase-like hydrolase
LKYVSVYGFDYDYTLALYNDHALLPFIYNAAKRRLVEKMNYPASIMGLEFDPCFAVRGLHFDSERGTIFKMDHLNGIQGDSVYFGREPLARERAIEYYGEEGTWRVPRDKMHTMRMLNDSFAIPEANLLSDTLQHLKDLSLKDGAYRRLNEKGGGTVFDPAFVAQDVQQAISAVHISGEMYHTILSDPKRYFRRSSRLREMLQRLKESGKKTFLLTNSPFWFVDQGMRYLLSSEEDNGRVREGEGEGEEEERREEEEGGGKEKEKEKEEEKGGSSAPAQHPLNGSSDWKDMFDVIITQVLLIDCIINRLYY